jgi:hypothetical protein
VQFLGTTLVLSQMKRKMNSVVTGSVEDILQWSNALHNLSVDPEMVEKVQLFVNNCMAGRDEKAMGR